MIEVGTRVQIPAHFDAWMQGKRFGLVARIVTNHVGDKVALVALDKGGTVRAPLESLRKAGSE